MMLLILATLSFAQDLPGEVLFENSPKATNEIQKPVETVEPEVFQQEKDLKPSQGSQMPKRKTYSGNLPTYYLSTSRESTESEIIQPKQDAKSKFDALIPGSVLEARIEHSVIAFPDEVSPVVATIQTPGFRNIKLIGESRLEKNSKRIFIDFKKLVSGNISYEIVAKAITLDSGPGLIGKYHTQEKKLFMGDFLSSFAAGYFEGTIPKKTNALGQTEPDSSVESALKKGMAAGSMATAQRFREKLKTAPEFSELHGPMLLQVLILE